jgi:hypothetical protein
VQVHHDEGVAIRIGPEPCAGTREGVGEASAGERVGQPLSREINLVPGADAVCWAEGHAGGRGSRAFEPTRRGLRPWHARTLFARKPGDLPFTPSVAAQRGRIGKARSRSR